MLLALLIAMFACATPSVAEEPVRILYDVFENAPLICGNGTVTPRESPGLTIVMLRMASTLTGTPIELTRTPWRRGLYLIETGQGDAIFASSFVEDRLRYGVYPMRDGQLDVSRKLFDQSYRLFVRSGTDLGWNGQGFTNLQGPIGATPGYAVVPILRAMGATVEEEPSHTGNLSKVAAGRLAAYAELDRHVRPLLSLRPLDFGNIVELSPPVLTNPYFLMFSKTFYGKTPGIAERIWDAIRTVNASPDYQALLPSSKCAD